MQCVSPALRKKSANVHRTLLHVLLPLAEAQRVLKTNGPRTRHRLHTCSIVEGQQILQSHTGSSSPPPSCLNCPGFGAVTAFVGKQVRGAVCVSRR